ncbi:MAG: cytochrome c maturation protein CcmE [Chitinophagaceae bacterium]
MKKIHIILIVLFAALLMGLTALFGNLSTYQTINEAIGNKGKIVSIVAQLDTTQPMEYDPIKNPNYFRFTIIDSLCNTIPVVYHNAMPTDFRKAEKLVLKGKVEGTYFECKEILMKCPSKYEDKEKLQFANTKN